MRLSASCAIIYALLISACGGSSSTDSIVTPPVIPPVAYQQPSASICDASSTVTGGLLCAIQPSRLDTSSRDLYANGSLEDLIFGFGYHVVAFPPTETDIKGVYIHLTGSYGRPYNQATDVFGSATFLNEALSSGYITLQIAYNNRFSINFDECAGSVAQLSVDNCSGDVRMEKIVGADVSTVNDTPLADSIEHRIVKLAEYLRSQNVQLPDEVESQGVVNWPLLRVGGHSQGATHALYLAKYFFARQACMIAGGFDVADTVPSIPAENLADWILDDTVSLDPDKIRAVVSVDDSSYDAFVRAYDFLGLVQDTHYSVFSGAPYSNAAGNSISGHGAALNDPRYQDLRAQACFSD